MEATYIVTQGTVHHNFSKLSDAIFFVENIKAEPRHPRYASDAIGLYKHAVNGETKLLRAWRDVSSGWVKVYSA